MTRFILRKIYKARCFLSFGKIQDLISEIQPQILEQRSDSPTPAKWSAYWEKLDNSWVFWIDESELKGQNCKSNTRGFFYYTL